MKKYILICFLFPLLFSFDALHKYYVSLTEIEYNKKEEAIQMIMNVFIDDLEVAINDEFKVNAQILGNNEIKNLDSIYTKYLKKHFNIKINDKPATYNYIGKEYDGNIVFFYLEIPKVKKLTSIEVKTTILTKHFENQQNLIKIKTNKTKKSTILNKKSNKMMLIF